MISTLDVYLILQLDSIRVSFYVAGFIVPVLCILFAPTIIYDFEKDIISKVFWGVVVSFIFLCIATLLPSTRTAAAMIILPRILNNEVVQDEAAELYILAKEALREATEKQPRSK